MVAGCHKCMTPFGSWTLRGPTLGRLLPPQARLPAVTSSGKVLLTFGSLVRYSEE